MNGFQLIEEKETEEEEEEEEEDVFISSKARSRFRFPTRHHGQTMSEMISMERLVFMEAVVNVDVFLAVVVVVVVILLVAAPMKALARHRDILCNDNVGRELIFPIFAILQLSVKMFVFYETQISRDTPKPRACSRKKDTQTNAESRAQSFRMRT